MLNRNRGRFVFFASPTTLGQQLNKLANKQNIIDEPNIERVAGHVAVEHVGLRLSHKVLDDFDLDA